MGNQFMNKLWVMLTNAPETFVKEAKKGTNTTVVKLKSN